MFHRHLSIAALASMLLGVAAHADAATILIDGVTSHQLSTATIVLDFNSQTDTVTFTATNTSAITAPGSTSTITAFEFIGFTENQIGSAIFVRFQNVPQFSADVGVPITAQAVPEPASIVLFGLGLAGLGAGMRRQMRHR